MESYGRIPSWDLGGQPEVRRVLNAIMYFIGLKNKALKSLHAPSWPPCNTHPLEINDPVLSDYVANPPVATISVAILVVVQFGVVLRTFKALVTIRAFDHVLDPEIGPA